MLQIHLIEGTFPLHNPKPGQLRCLALNEAKKKKKRKLKIVLHVSAPCRLLMFLFGRVYSPIISKYFPLAVTHFYSRFVEK